MPGVKAMISKEVADKQLTVYGEKTPIASSEQIQDAAVLQAIIESKGFGKNVPPSGYAGTAIVLTVMQNERRRAKSGSWNAEILTTDDPTVLCGEDGTGSYNFAMDRHPKIHCPVGWHWVDDWHIPAKKEDFQDADKDGWSYALDWDKHFTANALMTSEIRRRVWHRTLADKAMEKEVAVRPSTKRRLANAACRCSDRIAAGHDHFLVLGIDGDVYSFGDNSAGQCMQNMPAVPTPLRVPSLRLKKVLQVECGMNHSLVLLDNGIVHAAGRNDFGQCGVEGRSWSGEGVTIESMHGRRVVRVAAGDNHSVFLTAMGCVFACGDNSAGQLAAGSGKKMQRTPKQIKCEFKGKHDSADSFEMITAGGNSSAAVTKSGNCYT
jgi:hypothetical protein